MPQKYRHTVLVWRDRAKKAEIHLKFNLARRSTRRTTIQVSQQQEESQGKYGHGKVSILLDEAGDLVTEHLEKGQGTQ